MSAHLLSTSEDVIGYLTSTDLLSRVSDSPATVTVTDVTGGNMNRVFVASGPNGSLAIKQAPPFIQIVGEGWPIDPNRIAAEARAYQLLSEIAPDIVPRIDLVDLDNFVLAMEDLSDFTVLRDGLVAQVRAVLAARRPDPIDLAEAGSAVGRFVGELTYATSELVLGSEAHADLVRRSANPELCSLTMDVVLTEPYGEHEHNHWHPAIEGRVRAMYEDREIQDAVALIRLTFVNSPQGLLHGDLHSGSVMFGWKTEGDSPPVQSVKIFDPEFSFVGPIGMDLGLFWANLWIAGVAAEAVGADALARARIDAIDASWASFTSIWHGRIADTALEDIRTDAWRFAGVEAMRRVAGFAHAADLEELPEGVQGAVHVRVFDRARHWITAGTADPAHPTHHPSERAGEYR